MVGRPSHFDVQALEWFDETRVRFRGEEFQECFVSAGIFCRDADWARVVEEVDSGDGEPWFAHESAVDEDLPASAVSAEQGYDFFRKFYRELVEPKIIHFVWWVCWHWMEVDLVGFLVFVCLFYTCQCTAGWIHRGVDGICTVLYVTTVCMYLIGDRELWKWTRKRIRIINNEKKEKKRGGRGEKSIHPYTFTM
jgi:hypothetical protein